MGEYEANMVSQERTEFLSKVTEMVREFVVENFLFGDGDGLEDSTSFQDGGIVDSTGILELVDFIEGSFSINISDQELVPENLDSIQKVASFLSEKCQIGAHP
ncbi:MAG: acyl carrier protein [Desulfuromonadales bacterium]|jgi:acyl carrier protein